MWENGVKRRLDTFLKVIELQKRAIYDSKAQDINNEIMLSPTITEGILLTISDPTVLYTSCSNK